jgi:hypothetical protein
MSSKCVVRPNGTVLHAASPSKRLFVRLPLAGDRLFADVRRFANKKDSLPKTPQEVCFHHLLSSEYRGAAM